MKRCLKCDAIINHDFSSTLCEKHYAEDQFSMETGLSMDDLPDGLPIENFIDTEGNLDYERLGCW